MAKNHRVGWCVSGWIRATASVCGHTDTNAGPTDPGHRADWTRTGRSVTAPSAEPQPQFQRVELVPQGARHRIADLGEPLLDQRDLRGPLLRIHLQRGGDLVRRHVQAVDVERALTRHVTD